MDMYVKLRRESSHPGVRGCENTCTCTKNALKTFQRLRWEGDLRAARTELYDALKEVKGALDRYAFISEVFSSKGKISEPSEGYKHEERWKCGKIHGENPPSSSDEIHKVELKGGIRAQEAVFLRPLKGSRSPSLLPLVGPSVHFINFRSSGGRLASVKPENYGDYDSPVDKWKTFVLDSDPIVIVGWSLSCGAATKKTTVVESSGGILEDSLTIKITGSPKGDEQWHCRVTFVYEEEYRGFLT